MTIISLEGRLRKIEATRARATTTPRPTKGERDAIVSATLVRPGGMALALAALEAEPNAVVRERSRSVVEAAWRADA